MTAHSIPEQDRAGLRKFGITTGAIFALLFGLFFPWLLETRMVMWPWILFAILTVTALAAPMSLRPVYRLWMHAGLVMSRITTPLILGLVFFLVISPVALIMRVFGWDPMRRTLQQDAASYRVPSEKPSRESTERPY